MKRLIFIILLFQIPILYSQNQYFNDSILINLSNSNPDSLINVLKNNVNNEKNKYFKSKSYHYIAKSYKKKYELDSAEVYYKKEKQLLSEIDTAIYSSILNLLAISDIEYGKGKLPIAEVYGIEALTKSQKLNDYKIQSKTLLNSGWLSREQGNHNKALEYYFQAKTLAEINNDENLLANCYSKIAVVYHVQKDFEKAEKYYFQALDIYKKNEDVSAEFNMYNNIGLLYYYQKDYETAIEYYEKYQGFCDSINNKRGIAIAGENMGLIYLENYNDYEKAIFQFQKSLTIWEEQNDIFGQCQTLVYLQMAYNDSKNFNKTIDISQKTIQLSIEAGAKDVQRQALSQTYIAYEGLGNYKEALSFYKKYVSINDSLTEINKKEEIESFEIRHEYASKQMKDSLELVIEHEKKEAELLVQMESEKFWNKILIFGFLILLIIIGMIARILHQKKKTSILIQEKNQLLEQKNKEILDSIHYAKRIQAAILPPDRLIQENFKNSFVFYLPKDIVAGDFYWLEKQNGKIFLAVADCTGHGVPGAMVSVVCNNGLNRSVREHKIIDTGKILDKTKEIVVQEFEKSDEEVKDGMDISLISFALRLSAESESEDVDNPRSRSVSHSVNWSGANNPIWIVKKDAKEILEYKGDKQPIGKMDTKTSFTSHEIELKEGDTFYLLTDGYQDQFGGEKGKKFKAYKLKELILSIQHKSMIEQKQIIEKTFHDWKGSLEQVDDVCIIGVRV